MRWSANPGPQLDFLSCSAYEALYGGAAGGGKSEALLMAALRFVDRPGYRALLLRRTFRDLERSLIERARIWYQAIGASKEEGGTRWRFPSGAIIEFGHLQHDDDVSGYKSAEYQFIGFDELTTFTEHQYVFMLSRCRSTGGIPIRVRAGTNPGDVGHEWVKRRWAPWLDEHYAGFPLNTGEIFHYTIDDNGNEMQCAPGAAALSRVFVRSLVTDNKHIMDNDPGYVMRLKGLSVDERKRLLEGDWKAFEDPGALWKREWFKRAPVPNGARIVVAVDPSGSHRKTSDECGILVVGSAPCNCLGKPDTHLFVLEDLSGHHAPKEWAMLAVNAYHKWQADKLVAEENFGGAQVADTVKLVAELDPHRRLVNYEGVRASRGKHIRAEPIAGLYHQGRAHHCGNFTRLEDQLCTWAPLTAKESPDRLDALVWGASALTLGEQIAGFGGAKFAPPVRQFSDVAGTDEDD